jgi:hypothetical protein
MLDKKLSQEEEDILDALKKVFNIDKFDQIKLDSNEITSEINKIKKTIPIIYLFNILYELGKYYKKEENWKPKTEEHKKIIDGLLAEVDCKEIEKSQKFIYYKNAEDHHRPLGAIGGFIALKAKLGTSDILDYFKKRK